MREDNLTIGLRIFGALKSDVLSGRLLPDERLNIDALSERYEVSLSPLREALVKLAATGLVLATDRKGYRVAGLSREDLADIGRTRRHIERAALTDAMKFGDDEWEADIARALHVLTKATKVEAKRAVYGLDWEACHKAFHRSLVAGCGSRRLMEMWDGIFDQGIRYRQIAQALGLYHGDSANEHAELFELVTARKAKAALDCMEAHVGVSGQVLVETMDEEMIKCAGRIATRSRARQVKTGMRI
jgi:GntR family transcriptional regulator, carbon starvation induced regulator